MKRRAPRILTLLAAACLLVAVALAFAPLVVSDRRQTISGSLDSLVKADVDGWQLQRMEVAESAEMRSRVMSILRFDGVIFSPSNTRENMLFWHMVGG